MKYTIKINSEYTRRWFRNNELHREDGPACEYVNGSKIWFRNGKFCGGHSPSYFALNGVNIKE